MSDKSAPMSNDLNLSSILNPHERKIALLELRIKSPQANQVLSPTNLAEKANATVTVDGKSVELVNPLLDAQEKMMDISEDVTVKFHNIHGVADNEKLFDEKFIEIQENQLLHSILDDKPDAAAAVEAEALNETKINEVIEATVVATTLTSNPQVAFVEERVNSRKRYLEPMTSYTENSNDGNSRMSEGGRQNKHSRNSEESSNQDMPGGHGK